MHTSLQSFLIFDEFHIKISTKYKDCPIFQRRLLAFIIGVHSYPVQ